MHDTMVLAGRVAGTSSVIPHKVGMVWIFPAPQQNAHVARATSPAAVSAYPLGLP